MNMTMDEYRFSLRISNDENNIPMYAYITVFPPKGPGMPLTEEAIRNFLKYQQIGYGIKENVIQEILAVKEGVKDILIAQGLPPKHGDDAKFECLAPFQIYETIINPELLGTDIAPSPDLVPILVKGSPVLKKHLPTQGISGTDVLNKEIKARNGKDIPLYKGKNTTFSPTDKNILLSTEEGYPFIEGNTASIEKVLIIKEDVTQAGGNIDFDGIILIHGSVGDGLRITAKADVLVLGAMGGTLIDAGRNVLICGGVTGKDMAVIKTNGNINSKFVEMATLESGADIVVDDLIQSFVFALNKAVAQKIVGGEVRATSLVEADTIGLPTGDTVVAAGSNPYLTDKLNEVQQTLLDKKDELKKSTEVLTKMLFGGKKEELKDEIEKLRENIASLELEIQKLNIRKTQLDKFVEDVKDACVIVNSRIYPGVEVNISDLTMSVENEINTPTIFKAGKYGILKSNLEN